MMCGKVYLQSVCFSSIVHKARLDLSFFSFKIMPALCPFIDSRYFKIYIVVYLTVSCFLKISGNGIWGFSLIKLRTFRGKGKLTSTQWSLWNVTVQWFGSSFLDCHRNKTAIFLMLYGERVCTSCISNVIIIKILLGRHLDCTSG